MEGLITQKNSSQIEKQFKGILRFYRFLKKKPATFLELLWKFESINN